MAEQQQKQGGSGPVSPRTPGGTPITSAYDLLVVVTTPAALVATVGALQQADLNTYMKFVGDPCTLPNGNVQQTVDITEAASLAFNKGTVVHKLLDDWQAAGRTISKVQHRLKK